MIEYLINIIKKVSSLNTFNSFRYKNFPLVFTSMALSSLGNYMMMIAMGWLVLEMTDSAFLLGMVWVAQSTPYLLFGVLAGAVADKFDRRNLLLFAFATMVVCAVILGILISTDTVQLWHIFIITFIMGSSSTFGWPTHLAFFVDIVGSEGAMSAISLSSVGMRVMGIFGGIAAGVVADKIGIDWCYYLMGISYLLAIITLLFVTKIERKIDQQQQQQSLKEVILDALNIIKKNQVVRTLMIIAIICQVLGFSYGVVLPIFARDILEVGAVGLGAFYTAMSVGGLLGGLILASLGNYKAKGPLILGIFLFFGIFLLLFAQSSWYIVSLFLMGGVGAMAAGFDAMQNVLLQLNVTEEQRGRAMGIWILCLGFTPVGSTLIGGMAALLGAQLTLSINGLIMIATFFIMFLFVPRLRRI
ncbi:MFS transporter [Chloroflexota bacterium]